MKVSFTMAVSLLLAVGNLSAALYPVDDTARDPSFRSYVRKLQSAVDRRNTGALKKLVDEEVEVGPRDSDKGWQGFVARWRPADPETKLWTGLSDLLSFGFVQEHPSLFLSPYLVWRFPRNVNMANHLVVVRDKAELRESPSPRAPSVGQVSFEIVRRLQSTAVGTDRLVQWFQVETPDGKIGYLQSTDVKSPLMPRAQFGHRDGRWLMIALEGPDD